MKKIVICITTFLIIAAVSAQVPQALNYQAVARNSLGQIVPSQNIGVRFTIMDATGNITYYQETHNTTTNSFGLFTLAIGKGVAVSGAMAPIDWSTGGDKYLKVEIAPQGGTTYSIQGTTQLLSVPYALYAEKTKLVGGNAISITNGNTINANYQAGNAITITGNTIAGNYQAGTGINITGNVISSTAVLNAWLLNGNAGTTSSNFIGTTDNQPFRIRTNNIQRITINEGTVASGGNAATVFFSDFANISTAPVQLQIYGKDIPGVANPLSIHGSVAGMTWAPQGGGNNTLGRLVRLTQFPTSSSTNGLFFDFGIDQGGSYYMTNQGLSSQGPVFPKKMFTLSSQDFVGINFNWGENPTANFHTKGTLRFEGMNINNTLTRILATDANGNVATRDASTLLGNDWALLGNGGTSAINFVGTTDDQRLYFRTNNKMRMFLEKSTVSSGSDVALLSLSDEAGSATNPAQLSIWGREIVGVTANMLIANNVVGQTWGTAIGNTLGRMIRFSQMTSPSFAQSHFYDLGISQDSSFYISDHWFQNGGPNIPKKMITISPQNLVGINLNNSEKPTANFHTKGTLRFEGVNSNNALIRILAMDANGNVAARDASSFGGGFWVADANGIHNSNTGHVGIGGLSSNAIGLNIEMLDNRTDGEPIARFASNDTWQTNLLMHNTSNNASYHIVVGGTSNIQPTYGVGAGGFGIVNVSNGSTIPLIITSDNKVGIGNSLGGTNNLPKSRLHVQSGDVYIDQIGSGVIMKSPNGQCWRMTVSNAGAAVFTAISCP